MPSPLPDRYRTALPDFAQDVFHPLRHRLYGRMSLRDLSQFTGYSISAISQWFRKYRPMPDYIETALSELADKLDAIDERQGGGHDA